MKRKLGNITLLRHGKPEKSIFRRIMLCHILGNPYTGYGLSGICKYSIPPRKIFDLAKISDVIICSNLRRSVESARLLTSEDKLRQRSIFREYLDCEHEEMKDIYRESHSKIKRSQLAEIFYSYRESNRRANACAAELTSLSSSGKQVLVVGHFILNFLLHRKLIKSGYRIVGKPTLKFWEGGTYVPIVNEVHQKISMPSRVRTRA